MTTQNANDLNALETAFFRSLGNGVLACENLAGMVMGVVSSRDTTILTKAMSRAMGEKQDGGAVKAIDIVAKQVWPGCKITEKDGNYSIRIKGIEADADAITRLKDAVERKLSIRHKTFREVMVPTVVEELTTEQKVQRKADATLKWINSNDDVTLDMVIAALQARRNA